ncbi:MAG: hypothetical protein HYV07_11360 [Deltaproteobacteria bacterium]|nr:hypothetical protein [Deltaproteobacteria bacterium]
MDQQLLALTAASKSASQGEVARKKPGRKPKLIAKAMTMAPDESSTKKRKKPQWSEEARRAAAERSRRMWEARRKAQS